MRHRFEISLLALSLMTVACADERDENKNQADAIADASANQVPQLVATEIYLFGTPSYSAEEEQHLPRSRYHRFPASVRELLQHHDIEHDRCRGGSGSKPETLRACNRRERLLARIERLGWCLAAETLTYAQDSWSACSPGHVPIKDELYFSAEEIRGAELEWNSWGAKLDRQLHPPAP